MKKILISLLLIACGVSSFAQQGSQALSGVFYRVQDTVAYQSAAATRHAQNYHDIYWNEQATTKHWDVWNGSSYDHVFSFGSGGGGGGSGTVTSVGFTGGLISVGTPTTTPALTVAGNSGGIPYFSSGSTWASSAALAANALVIGGGAGSAPTTTTTGTGIITALGINIGSAGAPVVFNGALGTPSSGVGTNIIGIVGSNVGNTPAGNIAATNSQAAINELDTEKISGTPAALSVTDDTNYDLTLSGSPTTALLQATGLTISHSGTFAVSRGGTGTGTAFTSGSVLFATTSGVYAQDNSNLFWDDTNNRLGLGVNTSLNSLLTFKAGSATAGTAAIGFTAGSLETTARAGTLEYSTGVYGTNSAGVRVAFGGLIHQTFADVNNSGTSATDMYTRTLATNTLGANGESLKYDFSGTTNDATSTYQIIGSLGGQTIFDTGAITVSGTGKYTCSCMIVRVTASTARATCNVDISTPSVVIPPFQADLSGLSLGSTQILKYTVTAGGAGGGSNDATHKMGSIFWYPLADD